MKRPDCSISSFILRIQLMQANCLVKWLKIEPCTTATEISDNLLDYLLGRYRDEIGHAVDWRNSYKWFTIKTTYIIFNDKNKTVSRFSTVSPICLSKITPLRICPGALRCIVCPNESAWPLVFPKQWSRWPLCTLHLRTKQTLASWNVFAKFVMHHNGTAFVRLN